jgi:hypothetical protein
LKAEERVMRRVVLAVALLVVVGAAAWVYTSTTHIIWDGGYDLTVRVLSDAGPPRSVSCETFGRREYAEHAAAHRLPPESQMWSAVADPFDGQPITVKVAVSGRESMSGRELRRSQFRYLVVVAVLPDGRRVAKVVEIPDGRMSRELSVTLP